MFSLDTQRLTDARALVYTAYSQAVLAAELRRMGVRVEAEASGRFAVLPAIPRIADEAFSKGNRQTLRNAKAHAKRHALEWAAIPAEEKYRQLSRAAKEERQSKAGRSGAKAEGQAGRAAWRAQAEAIGWRHRTVLEDAAAPALTDAERHEVAYAFAARHLAEEFRTAAVLDRDKLDLWAARGPIGPGVPGPGAVAAGVTIRRPPVAPAHRL